MIAWIGCALYCASFVPQIPASTLEGPVPAGLITPLRIVWIGENPVERASCGLVASTHWRCTDVRDSARGIVMIIGSDGVVCLNVGLSPELPPSAFSRWARTVVLEPGGVAPELLHQVAFTAWKPDRPAARPRTFRFDISRDRDVETVRVSDRVWVVEANETDADAFVRIDGPGVAPARVRLSRLVDGDAEEPFYAAVAEATSISGIVTTTSGGDVDVLNVDLFEPLSWSPDAVNTPLELVPMVRAARTLTDENGAFRFDRVPSPPLLLSVSHPLRGRGSAFVRSFGDPIVVRIVPFARVRGRVVQRSAPVSGARVRFVPDMAAFSSSEDASELLTSEQITGFDGRFEVALPPVAAGTIQIIGPDGTTARVFPRAMNDSKDVSIGDINLPDQNRILLRLLSALDCSLSLVGPIDTLGMTVAKARRLGDVQIVDVPEPGPWALTAMCNATRRDVDPAVVNVSSNAAATTIDVRIR